MGKISSNVIDHKLQVPFTTVFGRKEKLKGNLEALIGFSAKVYEHTNTVQPHSEQVGVVSEWKKLCVYTV